MPVIAIDSIDDPRLDDYRNVPDAELLALRGLFIAEGRLVVRRLLERSRFAARSLLLTPAGLAGFADITAATAGRLADLPMYVVTREIMEAIAGFDVHRGCLASAARPDASAWRETIVAARTVVVLEQVGNPDNVGSIFRNVAAFGAGAVLLGPGCADPLYRKAIRTSMGAALEVPFASLSDWPGDLDRLRAAGFAIAALTPSAGAVPLDRWAEGRARARHEPGTSLTPRAALLLGHEGAGLSDAALRQADVRLRIQMSGKTDSLNVATAAAIALYELARSGRA